MTTPFDDTPHPKRPGLLARFRSNFLTGLIVIFPVTFTFWLIWSFIGYVDGVVLPFLPAQYHPQMLVNDWFGNPNPNSPDHIALNIRGLGVVLFLVFTVLIGWIAKGFIGRSMIRYAETLVERMPVVRSIYSGVKQIAETVFAQSERSFEKACLVEYPSKGIWAIGFVSTPAKGEVAQHIGGGDPVLSVFIPTTPNPTSGFLLFFPKDQVQELDMSIEDAAKLVISAGLVYPGQKAAPTAPELAAKLREIDGA
jgi:uncharacterized membrane protein